MKERECHRFCKFKWVKIVGLHRERASMCISTVAVEDMQKEIAKLEKDNYRIDKVIEL